MQSRARGEDDGGHHRKRAVSLAAKGLAESRISPRKIRDALARLRTQLPEGRPLSGLQLRASGNEVVVRHEGSSWDPLSGQGLFEFDAEVYGRRVELAFRARLREERAFESVEALRAQIAADAERARRELGKR